MWVDDEVLKSNNSVTCKQFNFKRNQIDNNQFLDTKKWISNSNLRRQSFYNTVVTRVFLSLHDGSPKIFSLEIFAFRV